MSNLKRSRSNMEVSIEATGMGRVYCFVRIMQISARWKPSKWPADSRKALSRDGMGSSQLAMRWMVRQSHPDF